MGEAGIFTEDDRVELIDGEIRDMAPISPPHAWIVDRLGELLITRLAGKAYVRVQNPIRRGGTRSRYRICRLRAGGVPTPTGIRTLATF